MTKNKERIELGVRYVQQKGGSLQVTVPTEVVDIMRLDIGDQIIFYYDKGAKRITLGKIAKEDILHARKMVSLEFSVPKDLYDKITDEGKAK
jgi:bifunctional DNA-binding transcriptional regulator/antitoxin component of YhaV-PrlF toxin-antitoxin module